jgi:uncharacterized DUF497 family protein
VRFEWDENKNRANQRKHDGIDFEFASRVFDDPQVLIEFDRVTDAGEERFHATGRVGQLIVLVVHAYKEINDGEETIRIISARAAGKNGFERYFRQTAY